MSKLISFRKFKAENTARPHINKIGKALMNHKLPFDPKLEEMLFGFYELYHQYININADREVTIEEIDGAEREIIVYFNALISKPLKHE
jgi:hypothetical protein